MKLLTLQRQAPVAPDAAQCRLCDAPIAGTLQDHLLAGQPGTTRLEAPICQRCGAVLRRLVDVSGPELCFVVQEPRQAVERRISGPDRARPLWPVAYRSAPRPCPTAAAAGPAGSDPASGRPAPSRPGPLEL